MDLQLIFELISAVGSVAGVVGLLLQLRDRHRAKAEQILIG